MNRKLNNNNNNNNDNDDIISIQVELVQQMLLSIKDLFKSY